MAGLQQFSLNLGGFISLMGGISLLEKGVWSFVGVAMLLLGLATLAYAFYTLFLERKFDAVSPALIIKLNTFAEAVLMAAHLVLYLKNGFNWPLHSLLLLILLCLLYSMKSTSGKGA